jgi:hypothetical protein
VPAKPAEGNRLSQNVDPLEEESAPPPPPPPKTERTKAKSTRASSDGDTGTATIYVSEALRRRINDYRRKKEGRENIDTIIEAVTANEHRLQQIIDDSRVATGAASGLFPADPRKVRYLGGGTAQSQFTPTAPQRRVLREVTARLGFEHLSTWLAPVLNEFLPGKKETKPPAPGEAP